jgi:Rieske Fe-S protein
MVTQPSLDRRQFVTLVTAVMGTLMGTVVGLPAIAYLISPALKSQKSETWIPLGLLEKYPLGEPSLFSFTRSRVNGWEKTGNSYAVYVLHKSPSEVVVFSNICTHLSCRVSWKADLKEYVCPCHDGHFDINGNRTSGPPPRPLDTYQTKIEAGNLFIFLKET